MQNPDGLDVYHRAEKYADRIDEILDRWPARRGGVLKGQMRRSADSIPDNIAEGCGMSTNREFAPYLERAIASTREQEGQLRRAMRRRLITPALCEELTNETIEIRKMTYGLLRRVRGN